MVLFSQFCLRIWNRHRSLRFLYPYWPVLRKKSFLLYFERKPLWFCLSERGGQGGRNIYSKIPRTVSNLPHFLFCPYCTYIYFALLNLWLTRTVNLYFGSADCKCTNTINLTFSLDPFLLLKLGPIFCQFFLFQTSFLGATFFNYFFRFEIGVKFCAFSYSYWSLWRINMMRNMKRSENIVSEQSSETHMRYSLSFT